MARSNGRSCGYAEGRALRKRVPRSEHASWRAGPERCDPVALLAAQNQPRIPALVPVRHGRMARSELSFFAGAARIMAADLASTPTTGVRVQTCGDAHLLNFGACESIRRFDQFDLVDLDETLPGPWEWDLKRLATSFAVAASAGDLDARARSRAARAVVSAYQQAMGELSEMSALDIWALRTPADDLVRVLPPVGPRPDRSRAGEGRMSERTGATAAEFDERDPASPLAGLTPLRELGDELDPVALEALAYESFAAYAESLPDHLSLLLRRFTPVDLALTTGGVAGAANPRMVMLLEDQATDDPLLLQINEAAPSVLEEYLEPSVYDSPARRVAEGQRLLCAGDDPFLGWTVSERGDGRSFYWRRFRTPLRPADVAGMSAGRLAAYAHLCGRTLARAHARSGDPMVIAGYIGQGRGFERAIAAFAASYAEQNRLDYDAFCAAIRSGRITVSASRDTVAPEP